MVPSALGKPHCLDMRRIHKAEARLIELSGVTKDKAGELIYCFLESWGEARTYLAVLRQEFARSKQKLRTIRGIIVLDRAADLLASKGLASSRSPAGSEDLRDSVVNTDPDYLAAADVLAQVEAAVETMESKAEKLKMAYFAINKLIDGTGKVDTSGGTGDDAPGSFSESEKVQKFIEENNNSANYKKSGFGTPKY